MSLAWRSVGMVRGHRHWDATEQALRTVIEERSRGPARWIRGHGATAPKQGRTIGWALEPVASRRTGQPIGRRKSKWQRPGAAWLPLARQERGEGGDLDAAVGVPHRRVVLAQGECVRVFRVAADQSGTICNCSADARADWCVVACHPSDRVCGQNSRALQGYWRRPWKRLPVQNRLFKL
jgi:hypothetical protein